MVLAVIASIAVGVPDARSQSPAETIVVPAGLTEADAVPVASAFPIDQHTGESIVVPMTVSGTITLLEPSLEPQLHDAFYCYSGCDGIEQEDGLAFAHDWSPQEYRQITAFVKGNTSGNFVATPPYDESHSYTFEFVCDENAQISCGSLTALGVPFADPAAGLTAEGSLTVSINGGPPASGCTTIDGRVTDRESKPIADAHVKLVSGGVTLDEAATGADGLYRFGAPTGAGADLHVEILAEERSHAPSRFRIMHGTETIGAAGPPIDPAVSCTQPLALTSAAETFTRIPSGSIDLAAAFDAYQSIHAAWTLAARMQPEPDRGLPLPVFLNCETSTPPVGVLCPKPGVHFFTVEGVQPFIAVDTALSSSAPADMANMLGHEFGHFFMWSAFGQIPFFPGNVGHAGYYVNRSSADAWTEGFASFFSLMVRRQVSREPGSVVVGSAGDMELDGKAWQASGQYEEFAVVGTLLDLADTSGEAGLTPERPIASTVLINDARDLFVVEAPAGTATGTPWRAEIVSSTGTRLRTINGTVVDWNGIRLAIGKLPAIPFGEVHVVLRPGAAVTDDDPIAGDLFTLWNAILNFRSSRPESAAANNHLFDVAELYRAAQLLHGSDRDDDGDGEPDLDEIFRAHGFFDDIDGGTSNLRWDPGERIGGTSHSAIVVGDQSYPAFIPRTQPPDLLELKAHLDTGGIDATALVHVDVPEPDQDASFSILTPITSDELAALPVPPPDSGATVSVIAMADGYQPAVALEVDPATFWADADENPGRTFLAGSAQLVPGDLLPAGDADPAPSGGGGVPTWLLAAIIVAAAFGGVRLYATRRDQRA